MSLKTWHGILYKEGSAKGQQLREVVHTVDYRVVHTVVNTVVHTVVHTVLKNLLPNKDGLDLEAFELGCPVVVILAYHIRVCKNNRVLVCMIAGQPASKTLNDGIHKGSLRLAVIQNPQMIFVQGLGIA